MTAVAVGSSIYASLNGGVSRTDVAEGRHNGSPACLRNVST